MLAAARRRRRDRGVAALIVAILFAGGALIACAAFTVDLGSWYGVRRQMQNASDAVSLSLAQVCATNAAKCNSNGANQPAVVGATTFGQLVTSNTSYASQALNANLKNVYGVPDGTRGACGWRTPSTGLSAGSALPACSRPTSATPLSSCPQLPQYLQSNIDIPYVEAYTEAQVSSFFARAVTGSPPSGMSTCARVAWGSPGGLGETDLPLTVSGCDWMHATGGTIGGGGGTYYPGPVYGTPGGTIYGYGGTGQPPWPAAAATPPAQTAGGEVIMLIQNPPAGQTQPTACPSWQGHTLPGGFGVLDTTADPCVAKQYQFNWLHTATGNNVGCNLDNLLGKVLHIPVFDCTYTSLPSAEYPPNGADCVTGNGNNAWYHRVGYAAFYLSGYSVNVTSGLPNKHKSLVSDQFPCNGGDRCISGWFVTDQLQASYILGPPSGSGYFGTYTILPAG